MWAVAVPLHGPRQLPVWLREAQGGAAVHDTGEDDVLNQEQRGVLVGTFWRTCEVRWWFGDLSCWAFDS